MILDLDYALREDKPVAPIMSDSLEYAHKFENYTVDFEKWEKSNRIAKRIIKESILIGIRGGIPDKKDERELDAKELLKSVEEHYKVSFEMYSNVLITKMSSRYDGQGGVMRHIMSMCGITNELRSLRVDISDKFLVESIMSSLPARYAPIKTISDTNRETWSISDLVSFINNEEEDPLKVTAKLS